MKGGWKPSRTFLHFNTRRLIRHMRPELLKQYREAARKDKSLNVKLWEAWSLSNGERTVEEIHRIVEAEYSPIDPNLFIELMNTMVKAGIIK